MLIKNVKVDWAFISREDDNGNYRVTFEVDEEKDKEIQENLKELIKSNGKDPNTADWLGSRKIDNNIITYTAKCAKEFTNKKGETIERKLPVFDVKAREFENVPNIRNGAIANLVIEPYFAEFKKKYGAMISLRSIQLIKYEEYTAENPFKDESQEFFNVSESGTERTLF